MKQINYTCDECHKRIVFNVSDGPICIGVNAPWELDIRDSQSADLCSRDCAHKWLDRALARLGLAF